MRYILTVFILLICFAYTIGGSNFAELNVQFGFLDFPIFIGEWLILFLSLLFFLQKNELSRRWLLMVAGYSFGLAIAALGDYVRFGPYTFRNAAMFYYPVFAFFAYFCFDKRIFLQPFLIICALVLILLNSFANNFWNYKYTYTALLVIALFSIEHKIIRWVLTALALGTFNYVYFFNGGRSELVGVIAAVLFVFAGLMFARDLLRPEWKAVVILFMAFMFLLGVFFMADKNQLQSLSSPREIMKKFLSVKARIEKAGPGFQEPAIVPRVYNPNQNAPSAGPGREMLGAPGRLLLSGPAGNIPVGPSQISLPRTASVSGAEDLKVVNKTLDTCYANITFRLLVWEDMVQEMIQRRSFFGMGLGHPLRSRNIEILNQASGEWRRDGWIAPHNSFLHTIYRAGIFGFLLVSLFVFLLCRYIVVFIKSSDLKGLLLASVLVYWVTFGNFFLLWELPYYAIPCWTMFGVLIRYGNDCSLSVPLGSAGTGRGR